MFIVPNAKVLVLGGDLKKCIKATVKVKGADLSNPTVPVDIDVTGTNGFHFDGALSVDIPLHMLTCKLDILAIVKKMGDGEAPIDATLELAVEECLRIVRFDISHKGKIILNLGLRIRGDLKCETDDFASDHDFNEAIFDFKK
jgi:hypothetical protein